MNGYIPQIAIYKWKSNYYRKEFTMKKKIILAAALFLGLSASFAQAKPAAVGVPNPMVSYDTVSEAKAAAGFTPRFDLEEKMNPRYSTPTIAARLAKYASLIPQIFNIVATFLVSHGKIISNLTNLSR